MGVLEKLLQMINSLSCIIRIFDDIPDNIIYPLEKNIIETFIITDQNISLNHENTTCIKINKIEYNQLLLDLDFWKSIKSTYTLVYDYQITFFTKIHSIYFNYDYIASCRSRHEARKIQLAYNTPFLPIIGSNMCSLRKTRFMQEILEYKKLYKNIISSNREDIYTSLMAYLQYKKIPTTAVADTFCYERGWLPNTFAGYKQNVIISK